MSEKIADFDLTRFTKTCQQVEEKENKMGKIQPKMNKNFLILNMHGENLYRDYTVPAGVRLIMFCYSGRGLQICPNFEQFIWEKIMLNTEATFNYCTFLSNLAQYPSFRDHFCVYNTGDTLSDLRFNEDEYFRDGLFQLPVRAAVMNTEQGDTVYMSSADMLAEHIRTSVGIRHHSVDIKKTAEWIQAKKGDEEQKIHAVFSSPYWTVEDLQKNFSGPIELSGLVKYIQQRISGHFTLLLLTCRTGKYKMLPSTPKVIDELLRVVKSS